MTTPPTQPLSATGSARASRLPAAFRSLRHRNYQLFFGGQIISLVGTWMQSVAESWLMYRLTGSSALLGLTGFSAQFPVFLLARLAASSRTGTTAGRIIITTQTCAMLLAGHARGADVERPVAGVAPVPHRVAPGHRSTRSTSRRGRRSWWTWSGVRDLINAIALNSSMFNGARIVGPAVAGVLVAIIGEGWCFLANSISYIAVIAGLLLMQVQRKALPPSGRRRARARRLPLRPQDAAHRVRILLMLGVVSLVGMPYAVLMPIFADRILHGGPSGLGMLMGALRDWCAVRRARAGIAHRPERARAVGGVRGRRLRDRAWCSSCSPVPSGSRPHCSSRRASA